MVFSRLFTPLVSFKVSQLYKESSRYFPGLHHLRERNILADPSRKLSEVNTFMKGISGTEQYMVRAQEENKKGQESSSHTPQAGGAN